MFMGYKWDILCWACQDQSIWKIAKIVVGMALGIQPSVDGYVYGHFNISLLFILFLILHLFSILFSMFCLTCLHASTHTVIYMRFCIFFSLSLPFSFIKIVYHCFSSRPEEGDVCMFQEKSRKQRNQSSSIGWICSRVVCLPPRWGKWYFFLNLLENCTGAWEQGSEQQVWRTGHGWGTL